MPFFLGWTGRSCVRMGALSPVSMECSNRLVQPGDFVSGAPYSRSKASNLPWTSSCCSVLQVITVSEGCSNSHSRQ